jgi:multidrug efflux pump subunit AcrB
MEAIQVAGVARFRPIVLTSLTTFFGLIPLLLEQSTQSQFLKPMAVSLGFGILFATVITLLVTPLFYCIYEMALGGLRRLWPSPKAETLEGTLS